MDLEQAIVCGYEHYADFAGEAGRGEFWWFALYLVLGAAACGRLGDHVAEFFVIVHLLPAASAATRRFRAARKKAAPGVP
jgi:uncharacterized membrane protein YhaH (DUF805 family)